MENSYYQKHKEIMAPRRLKCYYNNMGIPDQYIDEYKKNKKILKNLKDIPIEVIKFFWEIHNESEYCEEYQKYHKTLSNLKDVSMDAIEHFWIEQNVN